MRSAKLGSDYVSHNVIERQVKRQRYIAKVIVLNNGTSHGTGDKRLQSASETPSKASRYLLQRRVDTRLDHVFALLVQSPFHLTTGPPNPKLAQV